MSPRVDPPTIHQHKFPRRGLHPEHDRCEVCGMLRFDIMGPFEQHKVRMRIAYDDMEARLNRR